MRKIFIALIVVVLIFGSFEAFSFEAGHALNHSSTVPIVITGTGGERISVNPVTDLVYSNGQIDCTTTGGVTTCTNGLFVINGTTDMVSAKISVDAVDIAVDSVTNMIYLASPSGVVVINGSTDQIVANISCNSDYVAVNPASNMVYASFNNYNYGTTTYIGVGGLCVINGSTNSIVEHLLNLDGGLGAGQIVVNPVTGMVYVASTEASVDSSGFVYSYVSVIDGANNSLISNVKLTEAAGSGVGAITVDSKTNMVYVTPISGPNAGISVINGDTNSVVASIPLPAGSYGVTVNENTDTIYATLDSGTSISVINGKTNSVVDNITILSTDDGQLPQQLAFDPATDTLYVSLYDSNYVAIINNVTSA